ncbi:M56 family metallopeptidase [Clostridium sp. C2-6-12]|uniref:M56 family metallopeptidase n=1 Tax=Clostridium sp. C2-6-12 TaxID=2698832 RepID=UPI00136CAE4E|nr:M56 family metallopeptidase [Clostridium sp. C2-6-12]
MEILERIFLSFLQASLSASIFIILVVFILKIFRNNISIRVKNALWILVLIKLLIPVVTETNTNIISILYEKYGNSVQEQNKKNDIYEVGNLPQVTHNEYVDYNYNINEDYTKNDKIQDTDIKNLISNILKIASLIWTIGAAIVGLTLLKFIFNLRRTTKLLVNKASSEIVSLIKECRNKINIKSRIPVYVYDGFKSPCILGVIKPKIYIPKYVLDIKDNNQLEHIFLHELMHYKRKDLICNFLGIMVLILHWFNPLVWLAVKKAKLYREYACDASVLELLKEEEGIEYGMTLLKLSRMLLNRKNYYQVPVFFETNNQIKDRIGMIKEFKKGSYRMTLKAVMACVAATIIILSNNLAVKALDAENIIQMPQMEAVIENNDIGVTSNNKDESEVVNSENEGNANLSSNNNGWILDNDKWYYYINGVMVKNKELVLEGKKYKFDGNGVWIKEFENNNTNHSVDKLPVSNKNQEAEKLINKTLGEKEIEQKQEKNIDQSQINNSREALNNQINENKNIAINNSEDNKKSSENEVKSLNNKIQNHNKRTTGWVNDQGDWHYYNEDGVMQKNVTITDDGKEYKIGEDGILKYWKNK